MMRNDDLPIRLAGHTERGTWDATCGACGKKLYWRIESEGKQRCIYCGQLNAAHAGALLTPSAP